MANRRKFIRDCSVLAASAALFPAPTIAAPRRWREVSLADVAFNSLAAQIRSWFLVRDASGAVLPVVLIAAERMAAGNTGGDDGIESFSLIFQGDAGRPLDQNTYSFEHARIGRFEMFIVPIGCEDRTHCYYEAVFNRPSPSAGVSIHGLGHRRLR